METIYPAVLRGVSFSNYRREVLPTPDGDFLELDWSEVGSKSIVILCHGLEGNSKRPYMKGMAKVLNSNGYDVLSWSYRGCGDEINRKPRYYHSGATDDLDIVVSKVLEAGYSKIGLIGFSLGGNLVLKYAGEEWRNRSSIHAVIAYSVPVHLASSSDQIGKSFNWIYTNRFIVSLKLKVRIKEKKYPGLVSSEGLGQIKSLRQFDELYTSKLHGFKDAADYYERCSSLYFLKDIATPTLIVNARNDSFLPPLCYPEDEVRKNNHLQLLMPKRGGHVGFSSVSGVGVYWSERVAVEYMNSYLAR